MNACAHLFFPAEDFRLMITGCHMCYLLCIFNKNNNGSNSSSLTLLRSLLLSPLHSVFHLILPLPDEATLEHFSHCIEEGTEAQRISVNFSRSHCQKEVRWVSHQGLFDFVALNHLPWRCYVLMLRGSEKFNNRTCARWQ